MPAEFRTHDGEGWVTRTPHRYADGAWHPLQGGTTPSGVDPATLTTLRQVTNNTAWWRSSTTAAATGSTAVHWLDVRNPAKALRVSMGVHGYAGITDTLTGTASLIVNGTKHTLTWAGSETVTIPRFERRESDPLPDSVTVEAGDTVRFVWEAPAGVRYITGHNRWTDNVSTSYAGAYDPAVTAPTSTMLSGVPQSLTGLSLPGAEAFLVVGDSILESGWARQAAEQVGVAWTDIGEFAEGINKWPVNRLPPKGEPFPWTLVLDEYGTNNRGSAWTTAAASRVELWQNMNSAGADVGACTMVPYVANTNAGSTDLSTLDGQSAIDAVWRDGMNGWLRDGAPLTGGGAVDATLAPGSVRAGEPGHPLTAGICDIAAATEATNSRGELVWRVDQGQPSVDGIHPTAVGASLMVPTTRDWITAHTA